MAEGWIRMHRCLQTHWLWEDKPFSYGQAWIDLLMMVNHKDKKTLMDATLVEVPAGTVITSELKLSERWGWSRHKTRTFLKLLESDSMIEKKSDNKKTTIIVVNWAKYQILSTADEQQKDINGTSTGHQRDTNNNDKRMIKNEKKKEEVFRPSVEEVRAYCIERGNNVDPEQFVAFYDSNGWKVGKNPMKNWKSAVITWEKREREEKHKAPESDYERSMRILREGMQ